MKKLLIALLFLLLVVLGDDKSTTTPPGMTQSQALASNQKVNKHDENSYDQVAHSPTKTNSDTVPSASANADQAHASIIVVWRIAYNSKSVAI